MAFFYISSDSKAVVRRSTDYIPKMIKIAGAQYVFKDLDDENGRTSIDMSIETFYDVAVDEDYVIYTGSAMYQRTDLVAEMILDFHKLFSEEDPADLKYLQRLE